MTLKALKPRRALNKAFLKVKPNRNDIERFKENLKTLLDRINETESEEFHKNLVSDFLKETYYKENHFINTKGRNDLVIHNGKAAKTSVGVIIETKKPGNRSEMISHESINKKAFHELVLYYMRERITIKNLEIKHLIATNINEWFIFDASIFDRLFAQNKQFEKQFTDFEAGRLADSTTDFFYNQIAAPFIENLQTEIEYTYFDLKDYERPLRNNNLRDDTLLIALYKLLSPEHLLKLPFANDSNTLDKSFYSELLHIIGLTETKKGGKKLIERHKPADRNSASLIEAAIIQLDSLDKLSRINKPHQYGSTNEERLFNVALELVISWINRILFLKLLEAQLLKYHNGNKSYAFLNRSKIKNFDDLNTLFFQVLARHEDERNSDVSELFAKVPYLNSSLFEPTDLEQDTIFISNLRDDKPLPIFAQTVLKDEQGKKIDGTLAPLHYLFKFLNAYDFSSEGSEEIQEENKTLINASVLGLIFEKINGYKDGSFFTPGFITMYMSRETIRHAVVQKFNETKGWQCNDIDELYDNIEDRNEANSIVNSIKIVDPAVGSGHFLVSSLNEIIAIKNDLRILQDRDGRRLKEYDVEVVNDELIITDDEGELYEYNPQSRESQRVQEALFHEKQTIIENCLFGVDINKNSVKICRLRLWIELLKNAYYKPAAPNQTERYLETLPNIDINIKSGNSLVSRFSLDSDLKQALRSSKWTIDSYRIAVATYRNAHNKEEKREMKRLINDIKTNFRSEIAQNDPKVKRLSKLKGEIFEMSNQGQLFEMSRKEKTAFNKRMKLLNTQYNKLDVEIEEIKSNKIYENAFEWRFEFPEVLNDDGDFVGFDVVIGNPPYIRQEEIKDWKPYFKSHYTMYSGTADIYIYFIEKGFEILKQKGHFTFIMPNKFMQAGYGKPARKFLLEQNLKEIIDFGDFQVFDEATTYPLILLAEKDIIGKHFKSVKVESAEFTIDFPKYVNNSTNIIEHKSLSDETWVISNLEEQNLLQKINNNAVKLEDYVNGSAKRGIVSGLSEAFTISKETKNKLIANDVNNKNIIKPLLQGRDIKPYQTIKPHKYLIFIPWHFPLHNDNSIIGASASAENEFMSKYPFIYKHLLQFKDKLSNRNKVETGIRYEWYAMQRYASDYYHEFEKPKIMYQVFQVKPCFMYDTDGLYCNNSMWFIPSDDMVLLGLLNSKMGWWLISKYCTAIQNGYQLIWKYFSQIPIVSGDENLRKQITELVNKIISLKKENSSANTSNLESQIDQLIYQLYKLTEEEIMIVEQG